MHYVFLIIALIFNALANILMKFANIRGITSHNSTLSAGTTGVYLFLAVYQRNRFIRSESPLLYVRSFKNAALRSLSHYGRFGFCHHRRVQLLFFW